VGGERSYKDKEAVFFDVPGGKLSKDLKRGGGPKDGRNEITVTVGIIKIAGKKVG